MRLFFEGIRIALASLRARKLRSFLTLLGVIFGVMTVAAVIEGFFRYVDRTVTADLGANTVLLDKFGILTSFDDVISANLQQCRMIGLL